MTRESAREIAAVLCGGDPEAPEVLCRVFAGTAEDRARARAEVII